MEKIEFFQMYQINGISNYRSPKFMFLNIGIRHLMTSTASPKWIDINRCA